MSFIETAFVCFILNITKRNFSYIIQQPVEIIDILALGDM